MTNTPADKDARQAFRDFLQSLPNVPWQEDFASEEEVLQFIIAEAKEGRRERELKQQLSS